MPSGLMYRECSMRQHQMVHFQRAVEINAKYFSICHAENNLCLHLLFKIPGFTLSDGDLLLSSPHGFTESEAKVLQVASRGSLVLPVAVLMQFPYQDMFKGCFSLKCPHKWKSQISLGWRTPQTCADLFLQYLFLLLQQLILLVNYQIF